MEQDNALDQQYKEVPDWVFFDDRQKIELCADLGILEKNQIALFKAIIEYADKYRTAYLPFQGLYKFIYDYGLRENNNALKVENTIVELIKAIYPFLFKKGYCKVEMKDNKVSALILLNPNALKPEQVQLLIQKIKREYSIGEEDDRRPFPSGDYLPGTGLTKKELNVVSIKDLNQQKVAQLEKAAPITKVLLPNNLSIVITSDDLPRLYDKSFDKMKKFLLKSRELGALILMKLKEKYPSVKTMNSIEELLKGSEREPQFWATLTTEMINHMQSNEKDKGYLTATEFVKQIAIQQSEQNQRKNHDEQSVEVILKILEKYPVFFTRTQILQLREKHTYLKLYTERDYIELVNDLVRKYGVPDGEGRPPVLVPVGQGNEVKYIHRNNFFHTFFEKIDTIAYELKKSFSDQWLTDAVHFINIYYMKTEDTYNKFVEDFFHKKEPFLMQLMLNDPFLLFHLFIYMGAKNPSIQSQMGRFFYGGSATDEKPKIKPVAEIMSLYYDDIIKEAKAHAPAFQFNIFKILFGWLNIFGNSMGKAVESQMEARKSAQKMSEMIQKAKKNQSAEAAKAEKQQASANQPEDKNESKEKLEQIKKSLKGFEKELLEGKEPKEMIIYLEGRWNQKLNKTAIDDNVRYVKSKVSTRLKFMKNPTVQTIQKETQDLLKTDSALKNIRDRDSLQKYIQLLILEYFMQKK